MLLFLLLALVAHVHADVNVSVNFINTIIPQDNQIFTVCEAVNELYGGNATSCFDYNQTVNMITQNLRLNIQTVTVSGVSSLSINPPNDLNYINSYLYNASFFTFPTQGRATNVYEYRDLKWVAYVVSIVGVLGLMLVLMMFATEYGIAQCYRRKNYADIDQRRRIVPNDPQIE
jgi:hypothetical protein